MMNSEIIERILEVLNGTDSVQLDVNDAEHGDLIAEIRKTKVRAAISLKGYAVDMAGGAGTIRVYRIGVPASSRPAASEAKPSEKPAKPKPVPVVDRTHHTYVPPAMTQDIMDALLDDASHVLWLKGPTGCGKTVGVHYLADRLGYDLFQVNCRPSMGPDSFFGEKTLELDGESGQNKIVWQDGPVVQAMMAGLDEDGNEVGKPGMLFLDEAAAMPTGVAIALNRLLESDDSRRTFVIDADGGRVVRSHSKFRVVLSANTGGRGATDMHESLYTAQADALDISLLNRVAMTFRFGYDRNVEQHIAVEKMGDDMAVNKLMRFRNAMRDHIRGGRLNSPFGTRQIVQICDAWRLYRDFGKAVYYAVLGQILPEERALYNETLVAVVGEEGDMLARFEAQDGIDYL